VLRTAAISSWRALERSASQGHAQGYRGELTRDEDGSTPGTRRAVSFSTVVWPGKSIEQDLFLRRSCPGPGFDIIFFWGRPEYHETLPFTASPLAAMSTYTRSRWPRPRYKAKATCSIRSGPDSRRGSGNLIKKSTIGLRRRDGAQRSPAITKRSRGMPPTAHHALRFPMASYAVLAATSTRHQALELSPLLQQALERDQLRAVTAKSDCGSRSTPGRWAHRGGPFHGYMRRSTRPTRGSAASCSASRRRSRRALRLPARHVAKRDLFVRGDSTADGTSRSRGAVQKRHEGQHGVERHARLIRTLETMRRLMHPIMPVHHRELWKRLHRGGTPARRRHGHPTLPIRSRNSSVDALPMRGSQAEGRVGTSARARE